MFSFRRTGAELTDDVIYDNKRGEDDDAEPTVLGGGSIVIHKD